MSQSTARCARGHENRPGQHFCGQCGLPMDGRCPNGHQNAGSAKFCGECGAAIPARAAGPAVTKTSTMPLSPGPSPQPDSEDEGSSSVKLLGFIIAAFVLFGIIAAAFTSCGDSKSSGGDSTAGSESRSSGSSESGSSGSSLFDDWIPAVCQPGTYSDSRSVLRSADASALCRPLGGGGGAILIGQYSEQFKVRNDLVLFKRAEYATMSTSDGRICMFIAPGAPGHLDALGAYGFDIGVNQ